MPRLQIISKEEIKNFDSAPKFNNSEKEKYFGTNYQIDEIAKTRNVAQRCCN